jgi:hypothetical protein
MRATIRPMTNGIPSAGSDKSLRFTRLIYTGQIPDRTMIWTFKKRQIVQTRGIMYPSVAGRPSRHRFIHKSLAFVA